MKKISIFQIVALAIFTALLLPLQTAFAQPPLQSGNSAEIGCIAHQGGTLRFFSADRTRKQIANAARRDRRQHTTKVIDPCVTGQQRYLPAAVYAALALKHPEKFQPLGNKNRHSTFVGHAGGAAGSAPTYNYVSLDGLTLEPGFLFFIPFGLTNGGQMYGSAYDENFNSYVAVVNQGAITVLHEGFPETVNQNGTVGGFVLTDPDNFLGQAALFHNSDVELIPRLPGEIHSEVMRVNDSGTALVLSVNESYEGQLVLYKNGKVTPLDFGPTIPSAFYLDLNGQGIISGTTHTSDGDRGFRFDPSTGAIVMLYPQPTEPNAWAVSINNHGDILGYSFVNGGRERIGVWDAKGNFTTYFVEGIPQYPTVSNVIHFNDNNLIVITQVSRPASERGNSYLVPKPGTRVNLAEIVKGMPSENGRLVDVFGINNPGNMFGYAGPNLFFDEFLFVLKRTGGRGD